MKYDLSVFRNNIKDMIQWHPGEYSFWTADNIKSVNSSGLETSFSLNYSAKQVCSRSDQQTIHIQGQSTAESDTSNDASIGKQLIYVPENQANCSLHMNYRMFYSSWITDNDREKIYNS